MKKIITALTLLSSVATLAGPGNGKIVYGEDNRVEIFETSEVVQSIAASTAGMIEKIKVLKAGVGQKMLPPKALQDSLPLCKGEKFAEQSNAVICSGFLVGPDLMVTAGHCIQTQKDCDNVSFVFDYKVEKESMKANVVIPEEKIYNCKTLLEAKLETEKTDKRKRRDFSLIRLDRVVKDRQILSYRDSGKIGDNDDIYVIGHPVGLPTKFADGAKVFKNNQNGYFVTNLDTFGGNSGSAVFNAKTNTVEGILVRGDEDFKRTEEGCIAVNYVANDNPNSKVEEGDESVLGEEVSRITDIPTLLYRNAYLKAIAEGNIVIVKDMMSKLADVNIYDNEMNTAIMTAVKAGQLETLKFLTEKIKEVDTKNLVGDTALLVAAENNNAAIVNYLIEMGANPHIVDVNGKLPYQRAPFLSKSRRILRKLAKYTK